MALSRNAGDDSASPSIVGTMPLVAGALTSSNNNFLWFPPPMLYGGEGLLSWTGINVDGDSSFLRTQCYLFNINVRQTAALPYLLQNFKGAGGSAPV